MRIYKVIEWICVMNKSEGGIQNHTHTFVQLLCIPVNHSLLWTLTSCSVVPVSLVFVLIVGLSEDSCLFCFCICKRPTVDKRIAKAFQTKRLIFMQLEWKDKKLHHSRAENDSDAVSRVFRLTMLGMP